MAHECQIWWNIFLFRKKKKQNYYGPWVPNLIVSYQALHITKYWFFLEFFFIAAFLSSFFKPKQILFTEVNICKPKQDWERSRWFFDNFWNFAKGVKMANNKHCEKTLSNLKANKCLYDCILCSLYKMLLFFVIYISGIVTAFKINSFMFLFFMET